MALSHQFQKHERGNVLFYILLVIFILGLLTYYVSQTSTQQSGAVSQQTVDNQVNQLITYASGLGGALQQMMTNGENPNTLCTTLDALPPSGDAGYNTPPSNLKLYHPLGGGITYEAQSAPTAAIATNYSINLGSSITGVGCVANSGTCSGGGTFSGGTCSAGSVTGICSTCTGHIIFTAAISSSVYCSRINLKLNNSGTVPAMDPTAFSQLLAGTTVAITGANCASCVGVARQCVTDGAGNYGFYADLFPPQNSNTQ